MRRESLRFCVSGTFLRPFRRLRAEQLHCSSFACKRLSLGVPGGEKKFAAIALAKGRMRQESSCQKALIPNFIGLKLWDIMVVRRV